MNVKKLARVRRARKVRGLVRKLQQRTHGMPCLKVFRSNRHISAQVVVFDPLTKQSTTVASASTVDAEVKQKCKYSGNKEAAKVVGQVIAERVLQLNLPHVPKIIFDRSGFKYHGRIASLADGAREGGLEF